MTIGLCYDSPPNTEEDLEILYREMSIAAEKGDFNRRNINWDTLKV